MAFRIRDQAETEALNARTPRQKEIHGAKERFLRDVKGMWTDQEARRVASKDLKVITLGGYPSGRFSSRVKDWDGKSRDSAIVDMPYMEDGGRITHDNASAMRVAKYWSSRTDMEEHRDENGLDPKVGLGAMTIGGKVTLVGRETTVRGTNGRPDDVMFIATAAREGVHDWNAMMTVERDSLADFVQRYATMVPEAYREGVADLYAEKYVDAQEAKAAASKAALETDTDKDVRRIGLGSKGPASSRDADLSLQMSAKSMSERGGR